MRWSLRVALDPGQESVPSAYRAGCCLYQVDLREATTKADSMQGHVHALQKPINFSFKVAEWIPRLTQRNIGIRSSSANAVNADTTTPSGRTGPVPVCHFERKPHGTDPVCTSCSNRVQSFDLLQCGPATLSKSFLRSQLCSSR